DDGSTDGSWDLLQDLTGRRDDVRLLRQQNAGPSVATNVAVREARLPWLKIVDADDVLARRCTELLLDAATRLQMPIACGGSMDYRVGEIIDFGAENARPAPAKTEDLFAACLRGTPCSLSPTLIDRALFWAVGGCDERLFTQDYSLLLRLAWRSQAAR